MAPVAEDEKDEAPAKALDEDDIALLKTYGLGPYAQRIKDAEAGVKDVAKRVNEIAGIKESDTGLAPPSRWDLVSDKQAMQEEQPLQVSAARLPLLLMPGLPSLLAQLPEDCAPPRLMPAQRLCEPICVHAVVLAFTSIVMMLLQVARCTKIINPGTDEAKYVINVKQIAKARALPSPPASLASTLLTEDAALMGIQHP